jgi:hypothetical protein
VPRDRLHLLLAIRQEAVDHALRALAECIAAETEAARIVSAIEEAVPVERAQTDRQGHIDRNGQTLVGNEAFAAWSAWARARKREGLAALALAEAQSAGARAEVASARAAAQAVGQLIESRVAHRKAETERKEGHVLDDIARAQRRARANGDG